MSIQKLEQERSQQLHSYKPEGGIIPNVCQQMEGYTHWYLHAARTALSDKKEWAADTH